MNLSALSSTSKRIASAVSITAAAVFLTACCGGSGSSSDASSKYLIDAESFDLASTVALVNDANIKDAETLEKLVNDPESAINNVDTDGDDVVDYVRVKDEKKKESRTLEFLAVPSADPKGEQVVIAEMTFKKDGDDIVAEAGHPTYVKDHEKHYYRTRSPGSGLFMLWMFSSSRRAWRPTYGPGYYRGYNRPRSATGALSSKRGSFMSGRNVTAAKGAAKPGSFAMKSASARKVESRFKSGKGRSSFGRSKSSRSRSLRGTGSRSRSRGLGGFGK